MLLLQPAPIIDAPSTPRRSAQRQLRTQIADAIRRSTDHRLSRAEQAAAVEAELLVLGFEANVLAVGGLLQEDFPLAG